VSARQLCSGVPSVGTNNESLQEAIRPFHRSTPDSAFVSLNRGGEPALEDVAPWERPDAETRVKRMAFEFFR